MITELKIDLLKTQLKSIQKAVVLAPHPDDFDVIGVSLKLLKEDNKEIHLLLNSGGASGVVDGFLSAYTDSEKVELRLIEQEYSCRFFGLKEENFKFLNMEIDVDGEPAFITSNCEKIRKEILRLMPDTFFLPHGNDHNPGHSRNYHFLTKIIQEEAITAQLFLNKDPKTQNFNTHYYTPLDGSLIHWKETLLGFHHSQEHRNKLNRNITFKERILNSNRLTAMELNLPSPFAESFEHQIFENGIRIK